MAETVGTRIEALAAAKGLSAGGELAALFGVTYETLRKWREGKSAPNRKRQEVVSAVLGVPPEAFMHAVPVQVDVGRPTSLAWVPDDAQVLRWVAAMATRVPTAHKEALADNLAGLVRDGGSDIRQKMLLTLLQSSTDKQRRANGA